MADEIVSGVVEMVMGENDSETEVEPQRSVVCPQLAELGFMPRMVSRQITIRWMAELAILVPLGGMIFTFALTDDWSADKVGFLGTLLFLVLAGCMAPRYKRVVAPGGALEQLGLGTRLISEKDCKSLKLWAKIITIPLVLSLAFGVVMFSFISVMIASGAAEDLGSLAMMLSMSLGLFFVIPCLLAWWHSLKTAALLAEDAIDDVISDITRYEVSSKEWDEELIPAIMLLVTDTLPTLSRGWGFSLGLLFAGCGPLWLSYLNNFLWWGFGGTGLMLFIIPLGVFLVASDVARASSKCDDLMNALNKKRFVSTSVEVDNRLQVIEHALERLNRKQGLGFTIGSKVFDQVTLRNMAAVVASVGSAVVPILIAVWANQGSRPSYVSGLDVYQVPSGRYYAVSHVARNYSASMDYCASRGMEIASIHSQEDSDSIEFLLSKTRSEILLNGGNGKEREGDDNSYFLGARSHLTAEGELLGWEWEDGSPWDFEHKHFSANTQSLAMDKTVHLVQVPGKGWDHTGGNFWVSPHHHRCFNVHCPQF